MPLAVLLELLGVILVRPDGVPERFGEFLGHRLVELPPSTMSSWGL